MFVLKICNGPELSKANFHARLSDSKQLLKMFTQWCFVHWMTPSTRRKTSWQNACPQVTDGISRRVTSGWHYITESRLVRSINRNVILLQQFLPVIRQLSSEFFIYQQDSAKTHMTLKATTKRFPLTLPNVERF